MKIFTNPLLYIWLVLILLPAQVVAITALCSVDAAFWIDLLERGSAATVSPPSGQWKLLIGSFCVDVALLLVSTVLIQRRSNA